MLELFKNQYVQSVLDFIYPNLCLGCGDYLESEKQICSHCEKKIEVIKLPYCLHCMHYMENKTTCSSCKSNSYPLFSYATYESPMREIIIEYKFRDITSIASDIAQRISDQFEPLVRELKADMLIPIPLHKSRESSRGYNQALILANELNKRMNIPVHEDILHRVKKRKPQAKLSTPERQKNIESVFQVESLAPCELTCILVDDVVTTGSTVFEATKELNEHGYKVVAVISIAHAF